MDGLDVQKVERRVGVSVQGEQPEKKYNQEKVDSVPKRQFPKSACDHIQLINS